VFLEECLRDDHVCVRQQRKGEETEDNWPEVSEPEAHLSPIWFR
jgi:hypothetical protein